MRNQMLLAFLSYFLLMTYLYPYLAGSRVGWTLLVVPSVAMVVALLFAAWKDQGDRNVSAVGADFVRYDWQRLLLAFAALAPIAALVNGSPLDAAAVSILSILFVLLTGAASALGTYPTYLSMAFFACIVGSIVTYHLGTNLFGYLPWHEAVKPTFVGVSRVSLFPSLSDSTLFCILVLFTAIRFRPTLWWATAPLAAYFLYFSHSRTMFLIVVAVVASEALSFLRIRGTLNFVVILTLLVGSVGFANRLVPAIVDVEMSLRDGRSFVAERLVRKIATIESDGKWVDPELLRLYAKDIAEKNPHLSGRSDLWRDHIAAFRASPLIGVGRDGAIRHIERTSMDSSITGSESFFTRILAEFGLVALLFWAAIWRLFVCFDRADNGVGRALTISLVATLLVYGSSAVPYSFVFLCYIALIGHALVVVRERWLFSAEAYAERAQ